MPSSPMPMPVYTDGLHATECHPLPDGGMRCDPVPTPAGRGFAALVIIALILAVGYVLFDHLREWIANRKIKEMLGRWRMKSTDREK